MNFTKENVLIDTSFKSNKELFTKIASLAFQRKIISDKTLVTQGFINREKQGTTGFEDGFAIPHARVDGVDEPSVFVVRNKTKISGWEALDGNGVKYAIALLIPNNAGEVHMEVLSSIATKLIDEKFREIIKKGSAEEIFENFNSFLKDINVSSKATETSTIDKNKKLIVGISACPAGIAHTFMAKQKMEGGAHQLGFEVKWETQGAQGQKNKISDEEIERAEVVIIASDIKLDLSRFKGKRLVATDTNDAIKNGSKLIERALKDAEVYHGGDIKHKHLVMRVLKSYKQGFQSSFGTPWIYLSITGTLLAILSLIGFAMYGRDWSDNGFALNENLFKIQEIAKVALHLSMPFMAATIARKMVDRGEVFAIVFIATLLLNTPFMIESFNSMTNYHFGKTLSLFYDWGKTFSYDDIKTGSNIVGALVITFATTGIVKLVFVIRDKINARKVPVLTRMVHPWLTTTVSAVAILIGVVFLFGAPLAFASGKIMWLFLEYGNNHWWVRLLVGGTLGCMIAVDLGGFINKSALISLIGLAQYDLRFAAIISVSIPMASIGFGTTYSIFKNKFRKEDVADASTSFAKGLTGMTEGPLNPTNKYGWKLMIPNILSTFISSGIAFVLGIYIFKGGHIDILLLGAQAHLAQANDISFLNTILTLDYGWAIVPISLAYGILGYYISMLVGTGVYIALASVTFNVGKHPVLARK